nr:hypothetical protein [Pandoravirus aubagnensis]
MGQSTSTPLPDGSADDAIAIDNADIKDMVMIEKPTILESVPTAAATESAPGSVEIGTTPTVNVPERSESAPADGTPITTQSALDAALTAIQDPASVTKLEILFSHKNPIADATLLDRYGLIKDEHIETAYDDHAKNAFDLSALSAFTRLSILCVTMGDGCCHPAFVVVPRAVWSRLSLVTGDWATFRVID